jgi:hypothetical protein
MEMLEKNSVVILLVAMVVVMVVAMVVAYLCEEWMKREQRGKEPWHAVVIWRCRS